MKKGLFCIVLIFTCWVCRAQETQLDELISGKIHAEAGKALIKITKNYFRSHPLNQRFSSFIISLQKDPLFTVETYERRTDSTFFYLNGTYKNFNPFRYPAKEARLIIAEEHFKYGDSMQLADTIINLQLMGITDTGANNQEEVQKEFRRFHRNHHADFWNFTNNSSSKKGVITAEAHNYFIYLLDVAPVTIAWGLLPETGQYTFTITIRLKVKENEADLVM
jgi:hypothetical protein